MMRIFKKSRKCYFFQRETYVLKNQITTEENNFHVLFMIACSDVSFKGKHQILDRQGIFWITQDVHMIYVLLDGVGDLPHPDLDGKTPLEAANTPTLDKIASNGSIGEVISVGKGNST